MANYPSQLREREELNLRLGIKSSLSQLRPVIASLYVIYVANNKQAQVTYSKEITSGSLTSIKLEDNLAQQIDAKFPAAAEKISFLVDKTPLFTAQLEALQVGIELFFHLAKINFVASSLSERTGSNRFQKKLSFATNMILVDLYLSSHSNEDVNKLLAAWLQDKPFSSKLEDGLKMLLNTFTEETQYKIRDNNLTEIVFNQEGVYDTVLSEGEAISRDANEPVGPFRIYKSYIASGMHPYLIEQEQEFKLNGNVSHAAFENYAQLVSTALDITPRRTTIEREIEPLQHGNSLFAKSLQKIFYGAPGTGKSHTIQKVTAEAEQKGNLFRTTFHPDSDYATFVGCYKPSMESKERRYDKDELISKLAIIKNTGVTYPCHKFAAKYWESLKGMTRDEKKSIITACEFPETMVIEIDKGIVIGEELSHGTNQKQIVYRFVAQAFANAYVRAWQKNQEDEKVFLVIEEINRGNCAQIFGDLFQLLDRDDEGYSKYPIIPDADLADFICEHLQTYENIPEAIREGLEMKLPSNFYIWASMNTSDQSLFPIDSAFKRRWDWEYIPIENHPDEDYKIHINESVYDWWDFIQAINKEVFELTHSEDKQLGYFFVRPQNGIIDANMLVNKVYFYLWNDVFKDYDIESQKAFKKPDSNEAIAFKDFFEGGLNEKLAEQVLINLELGEEIQTAE